MLTAAQKETARDFAEELQQNVIAIKVTTHYTFSKRKTYTKQQRKSAAEAVGADEEMLYGGTRMYAKNDPWIKAITSAVTAATSHWRWVTIDYPDEPGKRLLKIERLDNWIEDWDALEANLNSALEDADEHRDEILAAAKAKLDTEAENKGIESAFDPANYPTTFKGSVTIQWSVHNFKPDERLLQLAPQQYQREQQRVARQFDYALDRFEEQAKEQLADLVDALLKKLNPDSGEKVKYTEAATTNLRSFFDRFKELNIGSDQALADLIEDAEDALGGTTMSQLKKSPARQRDVNQSFQEIKGQLDSLLVSSPARSIDLDDLED